MPVDEVKQIGLDRITLTVHEAEVKGLDGESLVLHDDINIQDGTIVIKYSNPNKGLMNVNITCPKLFNDTNEKNVTFDDLDYVIELASDLLSSHGIMLDVRYSRLGSFEVNFNMNGLRFYYVMQLIAKANINNNLKIFKVENKNGIQSVKINKNKYKVKIYKKSEHLQEQGQDVSEQYLVRFEVSTNDYTQKQRLMADDITMNGLINNWNDIEKWFKVCMKETIKKPVERYLKAMENECIKMLEQGLKPSVVANTMIYRQDMVDMVVFDNAIRKYYKANGKSQNVARTIKTTHQRLKKLDEKRYLETTNNVDTLKELYDFLGI